MDNNNKTLGWGIVDDGGAEIWDTNPIFTKDMVDFKDKLKLLFYPKKFLLYRYIAKARKRTKTSLKEPYRILDVGCGTGASVIEMKKLFGREVEVIGIDVVRIQIELAKEKILKNAVWAEVDWYDGEHIMFPDNYFDAIYTSDVLGHVPNVPIWLKEINRVLRPGGALAMFAESELGRHAYIRKYLFNRGLNVDPADEFHISLFSKNVLKKMLDESDFEIKKMFSAFWASFWVHPDEFYTALHNQKKFFWLRLLNSVLYKIKTKTRPYSQAVAEFYGLIEMLTIGRWVEAQGYVILGKKKNH
ncbi:MAG: class I SAM-dependent methyltransferase [bacterium]|nr:class I SAM-dependent methyltransferase [bacterium]